MTCTVCSRYFDSRNARAQHERRAHPEWKASPELALTRREEVLAAHQAAHPTAGADANKRFRELHPDREADSQARYRASHRQETRDRTRAWRASPGAREKRRLVRQKQIVEGKHSARMAVQRALARGQIERQPCAVCGAARAEAHHHNGYQREHWLDVVWLCDLDHAQAHHPEAAEAARRIA